jgi:hypothetical protein
VGGDDHARPLRRVGKLRFDDLRERQVAERAAPVPALVAALGDLDLGLGVRVEIRQRREPLDARESMTCAAAPLGVEKVVGER